MNTPQISPGAISITKLSDMLEKRKDDLEKHFPKKWYFKIDMFVKCLLGAATRTPDLLRCNEMSLFLAFQLCAQLGLVPNTPAGHLYLIPRNNKRMRGKECTVIIGYKGLMELGYRSTAVQHIRANVVYKKEVDDGLFTFSYEPSSITHGVDYTLVKRDEDIVGAYAKVEFKRAGKEMSAQVYITRQEIEQNHKARSASRGSGPWVTAFAAMCRKSALRVLLTRGEVPTSTLIDEAINFENAVEREDIDGTTPLEMGVDPLMRAAKKDIILEEDAPVAEDKRIPEVAVAVPFGSELPEQSDSVTTNVEDFSPPTTEDLEDKGLYPHTKQEEEHQKQDYPFDGDSPW
jgi:recombination protein RecT